MPISELKGVRVPVKLWTPVHEVESAALEQLKSVAALPWVVRHVAVMPDCHYGKGSTVGSVIAMRGAIAPAAVGVDIGCGMTAVATNLKAHQLPDDLKLLRDEIESAIPTGFHSHETVSKYAEKSALWASFPDLDEEVQDRLGPARLQMGTLGGGNHFIEVCLDKEDCVWVMLHSGSRNIGKRLADLYIALAKTLPHNRGLGDLSVILTGTPEMERFRRALSWAQMYAWENRDVMLHLLRDVVSARFPNVKFGRTVSCHHNYVAPETHYGEDVFVTRKGAISAQAGEMGVIPGSMGTGSYIVRGLGNAESFNSASHGAGRKMSRGKAKRTFTLEDFAEQTKGVECRKDRGVLDEIPGAYKDIKSVMENQKDLVEVVAELRQVLCVKG